MFVYPFSRAEGRSPIFVSMVINGPALLDIYIESASQPASSTWGKKRECVGVEGRGGVLRVIKMKFINIVSFLFQALTKPTYLKMVGIY